MLLWAAMATRTGPIALSIISWYSGGRSRPRLSTASDMTCQCRSMSRTLAASSTQRLVSQAQGHSGSNQKSTRAFVGALCTASVIGSCSSRSVWPGVARRALLSAVRRGAAVVPAGRLFPGPAGRRSSSPRGKLPGVAVPNLTRIDAAARAELLDVAELRPPARRHRRRRSRRRAQLRARRRPSSSAAGNRAPTPSSTWSPRPAVGDAQRRAARRERVHRDGGLPLPDLAEQQRARRRRPTAATPTAARGCTASSTRRTAQVYLYTQFEPADAQRMFACFDQPDLKATFTVHVTAPVRLAGRLQHRRRARSRPVPAARSWCASSRTEAHLDLPGRLSPGRTPRSPTPHEGIQLGLCCRASLAQYLDPDELSR